jgi:hypothetical protein
MSGAYGGATITENYVSRPFTVGPQAARELIYDIIGTDDEQLVEAMILDTAPTYYPSSVGPTLLLDSVSAEPIGNGIWKGHARYLRLNENLWTFDIGGGTIHMTQSLQTISTYSLPGYAAPNFGGSINVKANGNDLDVQGVDAPIQGDQQFSLTVAWYDASITADYRNALASLAYTWNNASFNGFAAGEVLFLGVNGTKRGDERWFLTYKFSVSQNIPLTASFTIGGLGPIVKNGWDYLWFWTEQFPDPHAYRIVRQPVAAYVERLFFPGDFTNLLIGT